MNVIAISDLRTELPSLIKKVSNDLQRLVVTVSGKPKAVVMSFEELESLEETAEILSLSDAFSKIDQGIKEAKKNKGIALEALA